MVGELVMLPVRVGVRVTRLWFRALEETASVATNATGRVVGLIASRSANGASGETLQPEARETASGASTIERSAPRPGASDLRPPAPAQSPPTAPAAEPAHVSEEPVLVEEFAEPGAEDGAGAQVRVDPPWDGYERMSAKDVIARVASADSAQLAAAQLYESANRRRQTVMNAIERELRIADAGGSRGNE